MKLFTRQPTPAEQLKDAAVEAAIKALTERVSESRSRPTLTAPRAVAAGAALYTVGLVAFKGRRFVQEQLASNQDQDDDEATPARDEHQEPGAADEGPAEPEGAERRAARKKAAQASLDLPPQRYPGIRAGRR